MFEFIGALFIFGTIGWWGIFAALWIVLVILEETERAGWCWITVIAFIVGMEHFGNANFLAHFMANMPKYFMYLGVYFVVGICWAYLKFSMKMSQGKRMIASAGNNWDELLMTDYRKRDCVKPVGELKVGEPDRRETEQDEEKLKKGRKNHIKVYLDSIRGYKGTKLRNWRKAIITWISCWPPSVIWTLLNDPIRKIAQWVYDTFMVNSFRGIMKRNLGEFAEE